MTRGKGENLDICRPSVIGPLPRGKRQGGSRETHITLKIYHRGAWKVASEVATTFENLRLGWEKLSYFL